MPVTASNHQEVLRMISGWFNKSRFSAPFQLIPEILGGYNVALTLFGPHRSLIEYDPLDTDEGYPESQSPHPIVCFPYIISQS
jgi:hypothetical protein